MPNKIPQLKATVDDWGSASLKHRYNRALCLEVLTFIDEKHLCDTNSASEIQSVASRLCSISDGQRALTTQLNSAHIKALLTLNPGQFNQVVTDNLRDTKSFCIILIEQNRIYGSINWGNACRLNQAIASELFYGYNDDELETHLQWLVTLNPEQLLSISDKDHIQLDEALTLNKHRAWQQAVLIGPSCFAKALKTASPHEREIIFSNHYALSTDERSQLGALPASLVKELLLLPEAQYKRLLEFDIESLQDIAKQLNDTHVHCDEAKADDEKNGWWLVAQFGYKETMQRIKKADQLNKIKKIIADARTLKGRGAFGLMDATGPKAVIEKFGELALPVHYPLDAPISIGDDMAHPLTALDAMIEDTKNEIAAIANMRLVAIRLSHKDKDDKPTAQQTESTTGASMLGLFAVPFKAIKGVIDYSTSRHPEVEAWYETACEFFPNQIKKPPSSCSSPSSVSSADDTAALPADFDGPRLGT
ncbi:MAG: hypothetical protein P1U40_05905 [Coxiellaceae bacterium]|nr:hypothetical protein [Coxiellaceae bacterium]